MAYGLRPVSHGGYLYNTGGNEAFPIFGDVSDATNAIGVGDVVSLVAGGGVGLQGTTPSAWNIKVEGVDADVYAPGVQILGVFMGCEYTDTNSQPTWSQYYPGSANTKDGSDRTGYVVTDPNAVFQISSGSGTPAAWANTYIGQVYDLANLSSADSTTGLSGITIAALGTPSAYTTVGGAVRVVGVVKNGKNETSSVTTPDVLVRWADPSVLHYGYGAIV